MNIDKIAFDKMYKEICEQKIYLEKNDLTWRSPDWLRLDGQKTIMEWIMKMANNES